MGKRCSILWVVTTQWRGQAWGGGGDTNASTPALDELAREGLNYRQATTPHPFGPWARAAMLTGVPSPENGVLDYFDPLPSTARTVAHDLGDLGYRTAYFGKWHLSERDRQAALVGETHARQIVPPEARGGFAFWEGFEGGFQLNDPWLHGTRLSSPTQIKGYQADVLLGRVGDWIEEQTEPWFAVASLEPPHPPYADPVPPATKRINPAAIRLEPSVPPALEDRARQELAGYYAHVAATDHAIGELIKRLPDGVTVVVTSVHGDMHGSHGLFRKGWPHEQSIRVPMVVRGACNESAGEVSDEPVSLLDLPAMTMAWARGDAWQCDRDRAPISMPSVVDLPDQCDRVWSGWRSATEKKITLADGTDWIVDQPS